MCLKGTWSQRLNQFHRFSISTETFSMCNPHLGFFHQNLNKYTATVCCFCLVQYWQPMLTKKWKGFLHLQLHWRLLMVSETSKNVRTQHFMALTLLLVRLLFTWSCLNQSKARAFLLSSAISRWHAGDDIILLPDVGYEMWRESGGWGAEEACWQLSERDVEKL